MRYALAPVEKKIFLNFVNFVFGTNLRVSGETDLGDKRLFRPEYITKTCEKFCFDGRKTQFLARFSRKGLLRE